MPNPASGPSLIGPNGLPIACWGDKPVQLVLDGRRFQWAFLLAEVQFPIIGVNFIRAPISKQLQEAPYVYVRRGGTIPPLAPVYSGPFRVLHAGPKVFTLEVGATLETVSVDWLKPNTGPLPVIPAVPAKRGRPKK